MIKRTLLIAMLLSVLEAHTQDRRIAATIDATQTGAPISNRIYGQFIEHIAGIINNGLWAEMLEDRKFYQPVSSRAVPAQPGGMRGPIRRWTPIGPDEFIVMDANYPYAGDHAPLVKLGGAEAHGFQQSGLAVRMAPPSLNVTIALGQKPGVEVEQRALESVPGTVSVAPFSVNIFKLTAK
jgi:alpha-N-arabinofuranosidase